jgi:hypothetical protein
MILLLEYEVFTKEWDLLFLFQASFVKEELLFLS